MRITLRTLLCLVGLGLLLAAQKGQAQTDGVLVRLQALASATRVAERYGSAVLGRVAGSALYRFQVPANVEAETFTEQLRGDPEVRYAETDEDLEDPEVGGKQIHFAFDAGSQPGAYLNQFAYTQVHLGQAHQLATGRGVLVAILDTGVTPNHPALQGHLVRGYNALNPRSQPLDIADGATNVAVGHGTMIAGIIARLAPQARILPIRVLNGDGIGTVSSVVTGIRYAIARGARVINLSLGSSVASEALEETLDLVERYQVTVVTSAGNSGSSAPYYPAVSPSVIAVASVEANNAKSDYSNYGKHIGLVAPGSGIRSTYWTGGYANWSGTSFAAPFVSATAALVRSRSPRATAGFIQDALLETAQPIAAQNPNYGGMLGAGLLDIEAAVNYGEN